MVLIIAVGAYVIWQFLCMYVLIFQMLFAWREYQDGKQSDTFKWSHQYSYMDCLSMCRGEWESPHERFMRGKE